MCFVACQSLPLWLNLHTDGRQWIVTALSYFCTQLLVQMLSECTDHSLAVVWCAGALAQCSRGVRAAVGSFCCENARALWMWAQKRRREGRSCGLCRPNKAVCSAFGSCAMCIGPRLLSKCLGGENMYALLVLVGAESVWAILAVLCEFSTWW